MAAKLDTAYLKIARATEHLDELKRLHDRVCAAQAEDTIIEMPRDMTIGPGETKQVLMVHTGHAPIPDRCRILIGDIANDFRSALDYLTGRLG